MQSIDISNHLASAACKHYPECGGCQLQHLRQADYRAHKSAQLTALFPDQPIEFIWGRAASRRRTEFKIDKAGNFGFFAASSHDVVPIEHCPAVVPEIAALIKPLQELVRTIKPEAIMVTAADSGIELVIKIRKEPSFALLKNFADSYDIGRVVVNDSPVLIRKKIQMQFSDVWVDIPPAAFLQPSAEGQAVITQTIDSMIPKAKKIAEFFCGVGTYSFMLAKKAPVLAYEMSEKAVAALKGRPRITAFARDIERFPVQAQEILGADVAVLNPPRAGAAPQCKALLKSEVKKIVMVSCDPQTLARDIKILVEGGFSLKRMAGLDQFHWTHHIETICLLERK